MADPKVEYVRQWLLHAERDLGYARLGGMPGEQFYAQALFQCQQAAEKALKGFLAFHDVELEKTHELEPLIRKASAFDERFATLVDEAVLLKPYAVDVRYPGDLQEPTEITFDEGIAAAEAVLQLVFDALPPEVRPGPRK
ncbi:MAG: hypothetical protein C0418_03605 [Coriobacteriaceae bacterium]|nr:hypothetical protein [Coriobacteriaceae bacterium]